MYADLSKYIDSKNEDATQMIEFFYEDWKLHNGNMPFWIFMDWLQTIYLSQFPVQKKRPGRKRIGITKKVSITLTADQWDRIEKSGKSPSEYIRMNIK